MSDLLEQAGLTPAQIQAVRDLLVDVPRQPRFVYPWDRLETTLTDGVQSLSVVGYGSLLNRSSSANTLSETALAARRPVLAFGVLRLFNYDMDTVSGRYGPPVAAGPRAALNARVTGQVRDVINGVLVPVSLSDVEPFRGREVGYDLEPVPCLDWEQRGSLFVAYVLCSPDEPRAGREALRLDPRYINGHRDLAMSLLRYRQFDEAYEYSAKALRLTDNPEKRHELRQDLLAVFDELKARADANAADQEQRLRWEESLTQVVAALNEGDHDLPPPGRSQRQGATTESKGTDGS